jgi:restriction endonuclease S subunit
MTHVETFKTSIIRIRDLLRSQGITGMDSMRHICLYLMSRYMTRSKALALGIPDEFAWETLMELTLTVNGGLQYALDRFYHKEGDCLVNHFDRLFGTEKFPFDVKSLARHKETLEILDKVNMASVDLHMDVLGWVYEQHLKTGSSAARDLGQFFTDRSICTYMTELCRPGFKYSGVPESMCDPSMGTGGFQAAYMKYYKRHYSEPVDWAVQQKEIHGCDTDQKVAGVARLNLFMEAGGAQFDHLLHQDSLYGDLPQTGYDVILANMPFGLDGLKHAECCERVKALKIRGTKSEPLFLQLIMVSLNAGGRCAVVVPDGMLVNKSACHNGTRKYLLDHFELKRVIKMSGKFFMNTTIKPSILFFENTGKPTAAVEFWDVVADVNGSVEETMVLSVPRAAIDEACSLDMRRYQEVKAMVNVTGFPMVTLGDVCGVSFGDRITQKNNTGTIYPVYGSGGDTFRTDAYNRLGRTCKVGRFALSESNMVMIVNGPYWLMDSGFTVESKQPDTMSTEYLWYCLLMDKKRLATLSTGSCQKNIDMDAFYKVEYGCPPLAIQQEIVATLDRIYAPGTTELADTLKLTSQAMDLVLAQPSGATLEPIVEAQRLMRKSAQMVEDVKAQMVAIIRASCVSGEEKPLSDMTRLKNGFPFSSSDYTTEGLAVVKHNNITNGYVSKSKKQDYIPSSGQTDDYTMVVGDIVISMDFDCGKVGKVVEDGWVLNQRVCLVRTLSEGVLRQEYLYWLLRWGGFYEKMQSVHTGTTIKHISGKDITTATIRVPSVSRQDATLARLDALQSQLAALESLQRQSEDNARFILESYLHTDASAADDVQQASSASEVESASEDDEKEEPRVERSTPIRRPRSVSPARSASAAESAATEAPIPDYESMSLAALKDLCKARGLRGLSGKKKEELVVILRDLS